MGKKVKRKTYVSKGQRVNVAKSTLKLVSQSQPMIDKILNKVDAWRAGKNPWITVPGPGPSQLFKRVRANAEWGDPKRLSSTFGKED